MGSTFSGVTTALSSLYAQRRALEVTGQNIANANTDGYSRQKVDLASIGAVQNAGRYSTTDSTGIGVQVVGVSRSTDEIMETRARSEHAQDAYLAGQKQVYADIEVAVGEPSDTGLQSQLSQLWASMHDVSNRPGDLAARTAMLAHAATTAAALGTSADRLDQLYAGNREQLVGYVTDVNNTAGSVAQLNNAIIAAQSANLPTNELLDHRDTMILHLAEMTGGTAIKREDGSMDFMVAGSQLISGNSVRTMRVSGANLLDNQAADPVKVTYTDNGGTVSCPAGTMAASMEAVTVTLPKYRLQLDQTAANLASAVNTQHKLGFDLNGAAGVDIFTGTTATTLAVGITDPKMVAASNSATQTLGGDNADAMGGIGRAPGGPDAFYRKFVVDLGVAAQSVNRRADIQTRVTQDVDQARTSQTGVNLDEEMTNMLTFQRGYEAAAQVMKAVNDSLETMMNALGR